MTATKNAPGGNSPPSTGFAARRRGIPRRRSPAMVSIGVLLVVLGALGAWRFVGIAAAGTHPYLAVFRTVPQGARITAADLQVVRITSAAGLSPISANQRRTVIGKFAKVELVAGTLLTAGEVTDASSPESGQALIGVALKPNQRPSRPLRAGDKVKLIETPDPSASNVDPNVVAHAWPASVQDVAAPQDDGSQVVDVIVGESDVSAIATMSNAGRIVAVLVAGG